MAEVPTVRVDSLHAACDKWCEFPVADRPDALRKWLQTDDSRRGGGSSVETDYVWKRPLSLPPVPPAVGVPLPLHQPELSQTSRGDDETHARGEAREDFDGGRTLQWPRPRR